MAVDSNSIWPTVLVQMNHSLKISRRIHGSFDTGSESKHGQDSGTGSVDYFIHHNRSMGRRKCVNNERQQTF